MRITAVKTYIVPSELSATPWGPGVAWVLVKLETDAGITGWGQAYTFRDREMAIASMVHQFAPVLDGMDPFCIKQFMTTALDTITDPVHSSIERNHNEVAAAAAGIEIALWDIVGKALDTPVHRLLGGPCHDRVDVYANCWSDVLRSPEEIAAFAADQVKLGFNAVKIYPFLYGATVDDGKASLDAVRDVVGPNVSVFVDMWYKMSDDDLPQIIDVLRAHGVRWFEDPAVATDVATLARIRTQSGLPVVSGETLYLKQDFRRLLEGKAADILNPDITLCGIQGTTEIAAMADAFSVSVSVHNNNTMTIGLAAAMQAAAVISNVTRVEYFSRFVTGSNAFSSFTADLDEDGCIAIPQEPGIGVTVDEASVAAMHYTPVLND